MSESIDFRERQGRPTREAAEQARGKREWEKPKMEDVSEQVMAQPYIRFT